MLLRIAGFLQRWRLRLHVAEQRRANWKFHSTFIAAVRACCFWPCTRQKLIGTPHLRAVVGVSAALWQPETLHGGLC
jgi:hypothetical protein